MSIINSQGISLHDTVMQFSRFNGPKVLHVLIRMLKLHSSRISALRGYTFFCTNYNCLSILYVLCNLWSVYIQCHCQLLSIYMHFDILTFLDLMLWRVNWHVFSP
uniref:Uncharacterized protein n=1 Tax=Arundo donax TaxID=35708 RepID=A0A0A9D0K7_ARUDO